MFLEEIMRVLLNPSLCNASVVQLGPYAFPNRYG